MSGQRLKEVDHFLNKAKKWQAEMGILRDILVSETGLVEELKWAKPCYQYEGKNVVIIQGFKDYCALLFFKGVLIDDPFNFLIKTGKNTEIGRQLRYTSVEQIHEQKQEILELIRLAVEVEKSGVKIEKPKSTGYEVPCELEEIFDRNEAFKEAFYALTPGRQKAYAYYFADAKQSQTRINRIEKYMDRIMDGIGLNDR